MGLFGKREERTVAFVDISSGSVAGAIVRLGTKQPTILFSTRIEMEERAEGELGMLRALDSLTYAFTEASSEVRTRVGQAHIAEAYATVGAPWLNTTISTKREEAKGAFTISESYLHTLLETKDNEGITRSELLSTTLNGYAVSNPLGKRVKEAEFTILTSTIPTETHGHLTKSLRRIAPTATLIPHAAVVAGSIATLFPKQTDHLSLFVSEECTEAVIVKGGIARTVLTLATGTETFTRAARAGGISQGGELIDTTRNTRLGEAMQEAENAWLTSITTELGAVSAGHALPATVFLIADKNSRDFLKRLLLSEPVQKLWLSGGKVNIVPILPEQLTPFMTLLPQATPDIPLELLALYLGRTTGLSR